MKALAEEKRRVLIGTLADVDDVIADRFLMEEEPTIAELQVISISYIFSQLECHTTSHYRSQIHSSLDGICTQ